MTTVKILTLLLTIFAARSQTQNLGDPCEKDGVQGVCKQFRSCKQAIIDLKSDIPTQNCSFIGSTPIVCCIESTTTISVGNTCPPIPEKHIRVKKTGQKAWDKCIDWIEHVIPCTSGGSLLLNQPLVRTDNCAHSVATLIIGGEMAGKDEFPHMAHLGYDDEKPGQVLWGCGGTLISERWVMTAAHCLFSIQLQRKVKYVRLGSLNSDGELHPDLEFTISQLIPHPDYTSPASYNDIGLIQLNKDAKLSPAVVPACLHTGNQINDEKMLATGWGYTTDGGNSSKILQKVVLEKFNNNECSMKSPDKRKYPKGFDAATQICAGHHTEAKDTCRGDSGGPLQIYNADIHCMYTIVGITSSGAACGYVGNANIYTKVSTFVPWIEQHVWP